MYKYLSQTLEMGKGAGIQGEGDCRGGGKEGRGSGDI